MRERLKERPRAKGRPLEHVLGQAEEIRENIEDASAELASVNEVLKRDEVTSPAEAIDAAIVRNEETEQQVAKAADDLDEVNAELAHEVTVRVAVESRLADMKIDLDEARAELAFYKGPYRTRPCVSNHP